LLDFRVDDRTNEQKMLQLKRQIKNIFNFLTFFFVLSKKNQRRIGSDHNECVWSKWVGWITELLTFVFFALSIINHFSLPSLSLSLSLWFYYAHKSIISALQQGSVIWLTTTFVQVLFTCCMIICVFNNKKLLAVTWIRIMQLDSLYLVCRFAYFEGPSK